MRLKFEAEAVEVEINDLNILFIGFYSEENYLMIQQSLDEPEMNYHIERDNQSYGGYGGVSRIVLEQNSIAVDFDDAGKENLQCDAIRVDFETDEEIYELLSEKLKFIFGETLKIN